MQFGVAFTAHDGSVFLPSDCSFRLKLDGRPSFFWHDRPRQPIHVQREIVNPSQNRYWSKRSPFSMLLKKYAEFGSCLQHNEVADGMSNSRVFDCPVSQRRWVSPCFNFGISSMTSCQVRLAAAGSPAFQYTPGQMLEAEENRRCSSFLRSWRQQAVRLRPSSLVARRFPVYSVVRSLRSSKCSPRTEEHTVSRVFHDSLHVMNDEPTRNTRAISVVVGRGSANRRGIVTSCFSSGILLTTSTFDNSPVFPPIIANFPTKGMVPVVGLEPTRLFMVPGF